MKEAKIYKKENNPFQNSNWLAFLEGYGFKSVCLKGVKGIILDLPFGKKGIWVQKGPEKVLSKELKERNFTQGRLCASSLPKGTVFIRLEPREITPKAKKDKNLKKVTKKSLLCGQASPSATRVLDLSMSEEDLLAQMKPKTRYNIRLSQKKGVVVRALDDSEVLFSLLLDTAKKGKGYFPREKSYYQKLIKDLASSGEAHIFVAEHKGDYLAAILVLFFNETAIYLHGGQADKKKNLMAPYLCQWEAIRYAKKAGCKYYDFWGVSENNDANDEWAGITKFKEGFGGEKIIFPGSYDYVIDHYWYNVLAALAKLRRLIRR